MFCEECGAKNESEAAFCAECGHKFKVEKSTKKPAKEKTEVVEQPKVEKPTKIKKPMSKGKKVLIGFILVVVAAMVGSYMYISSTLKPGKIALKYFKAYADGDAKKISEVITVNESEFVNKKLLIESLKDEEKIKLSNYSVEKTVKSDNGLSAMVTIKYVLDGSTKERTKTVKLTKKKNKKWLFFENWAVDSSELVAEDYNINVPSGATAYINGIEIKDKYKKDSYSSNYDTYVIPSILKGEYTVDAKLKSGIKLTGTASIKNSYSSFSSSSFKLDEKIKETLVKDIKKKVKSIYEAVIDEKSYEEIEELFNEDYSDDFDTMYSRLKDSIMTEYHKLKDFDITSMKITNYSIYDDDLRVTVQMKYNYKVEYKYSDEAKEYSKKDKTSTFYVKYKLNKKDYVMTEISNLVSYFTYYNY